MPAEPAGRVAQLPLDLRLPEPGGLDDFIGDGNEAVVAAVAAWVAGASADWPAGGAGQRGEPYLFIHGPADSGKSRLLRGAIEAVAANGRRALLLGLGRGLGPGSGLDPDRSDLTPEVLAGLERLDAVALDGVDAVLGQADWEVALFSLYNRLRAAGRGLLVAARRPPAQLRVGLPDLGSRLAAGAIFGLRPLDEAGCARLLATAAARRGLDLNEPARRYILTRCPRDPASLIALVARLDRETLAAGRAPTVWFLGRLLSELAPGDEPPRAAIAAAEASAHDRTGSPTTGAAPRGLPDAL